ncbi:MAG: antibiotic biosynthesis monooxygenase [Bacteroidaceae bacterium]|nr:antibiotic biosynthesis monooxygenase [Bacteroidaceae bacterium]
MNCPMKVAAENRDAVIALGKELVAGSQQDEGNISYDLFLSTTDSTRMLIFETWADQPSLDKHSAAEHFTRIVPQLKEKSEMGVVTFEMAAPGTAE